jgi:hypothetical protein
MDILPLMTIIFTIVILLFSLKGLLNIYSIISWRNKERENFFKNKSKSASTYFYLIVPALREQNVICRTLDRLSSFKYDKKMFEIIVALDAKERKSLLKGNKSTLDVLKEYISKKGNQLPKVSFIEYVGEGQKRAFQLNAVLDKISNFAIEKKVAFVGVYDADSHPDLNTLAYIDQAHKMDSSKVAFQQILNYLLNSDKLTKVKNSSWVLGNAYYQTLWNYIFELKQFFNTNKAISLDKQSLLPPYCMGHGEFFEFKTLKSIGGFPKDGAADGIQIGFLLSLNKIMIHPVPFDDYCESPESLPVIYKQHTFWLFGNIQFFRILSTQKIGSIWVVQSMFHLFLSIKWALRPFFFLFTLLLAVYTKTYLASIVLVLIPFIYYLTGYFLLSRFVNKDADFVIQRLKYFGLEIILGMFFKSFGAINGFIKIIKKVLFGIEPTFKKIER